MSKNLKKVLSLFLCLTLVATLGASAFADGPKDPGKGKDVKPESATTQEGPATNGNRKDEQKTNPEAEDDEFDYDDEELDEPYTFDMSEIFAQIKDPEERANVESLYEDYMQACDEEQKAYDKMITAEDAFFDALDSAEMDEDFVMPEGGDFSVPDEEEVDDTLEDIQDLNLDEVLDILMQFISWYNSISNATESVQTTPQPSSTPQTGSSQPSMGANSIS